MKHFILLFIIGISLSLSLNAWENKEFALEGRVSYFHPFSHKVKKIYKNGWPIYELQFSQSICNEWKAWLGGSWMGTSGHSTCLHNKTRFRERAVRFGLQKQFCLMPCLQFYLGGGLSCNFLRIHDKSPFVKRHSSKSAFGGIAQVGCYYYFTDCFFLDLNFEYLYQRFHFSGRNHGHVRRHDVNFSGTKIGAGLGVVF